MVQHLIHHAAVYKLFLVLVTLSVVNFAAQAAPLENGSISYGLIAAIYAFGLGALFSVGQIPCPTNDDTELRSALWTDGFTSLCTAGMSWLTATYWMRSTGIGPENWGWGAAVTAVCILVSMVAVGLSILPRLRQRAVGAPGSED